MRSSLPARAQLLSVLALTGTMAAAVAATRSTIAKPAVTTTTVPGDEWLDKLKGSHRELFDTPAPNGGVPLVHVMMYYDTYKNAYGAKDSDVNGILDVLRRDHLLRREQRDVGEVSHRRIPRGERPEDEQAGDVESVASRTGRTRDDDAAGEHRIAAEARRQ